MPRRAAAAKYKLRAVPARAASSGAAISVDVVLTRSISQRETGRGLLRPGTAALRLHGTPAMANSFASDQRCDKLRRMAKDRLFRLKSAALISFLLAFIGARGAGFAGTQLPRALPQGQPPNDARLQPLEGFWTGHFARKPCATPAEWTARAARVRRELAVALGLWPMPEKTPLNTVIHGKMERPGYTIEKVYFESVPGFFVTGSLYRPQGKTGPFPGVLSPHGHFKDGRFYEDPAENLSKEIAAGAEKFPDGGRSLLQARCAQLARMGCVVFHYDMIGYADSVQIPQSLAHGFSKQRPEMNAAENWGLFSPQAEEHLQSVMSLQTWDSIRALDSLLSLPDVDPARIGVTGESGGGTQTFILCAMDDRPTVAFPAVMVSTAMQGGCTCENACLLRVDTGNVEIAALFAPKPLGMTAANDWTKEMATKGFPELQQHFAMLGAPQNVMLKPLLQFRTQTSITRAEPRCMAGSTSI